MSRTNRWRRAFNFGRALAKRSSSAVVAVFPSAPSLVESASSGFRSELEPFFFTLRAEVFEFDTLDVFRLSTKIVEVHLEPQPRTLRYLDRAVGADRHRRNNHVARKVTRAR